MLPSSSTRLLAASRLHALTTSRIRGLATVSAANPAHSYKVVVIGGGSAGMAVTAQLALDALFRKGTRKDILMIDPSDVHYYQPLWTFVGAGLKQMKESERPMGQLVPKQAEWLKDRVSRIDPAANIVTTGSNRQIKYEYLVVAPGIKLDFEKIPGLVESLGKDGVTSNYAVQSVEKTSEFLKAFKGGNAIFTQPATPIKCAGAPQKIAYLAEELFRTRGLRPQTNVRFHTGMGKIFAIDKYAAPLTEICASRNIAVHLFSNLIALRPDAKQAVFRDVSPTASAGKETIVDYDFIHVTPPMSAPPFIRQSGLGNADGWVDVDKETTQHVKYPNVYALGDASSLPTSKTAAAAAAESAVTTHNLLRAIKNGTGPAAAYGGYTSCPLITGKGKLILAEFSGYTGKPQETFFYDQSKESALSYALTANIIPSLYWEGQVKGLWKGPGVVRRITNPFDS
ncbi:mitochondrial sulfide:quinone oxidoreductase [Fimicolochytrium jonesii]|uniref:mitochondrial sulfide:quinone oxidoreductase n=1 Tax=Fimicolochytrium jonesii TaxID=1396493 RepID=UPI0022FE9955|nr:mitochondrial sulfide:quinone oxidoreductase [Fimicolochytrium jonesii]KAI8816239.1 mitochondrial sulfide:quinone oxidoreductase [Fimicolochytrium jonesii]